MLNRSVIVRDSRGRGGAAGYGFGGADGAKAKASGGGYPAFLFSAFYDAAPPSPSLSPLSLPASPSISPSPSPTSLSPPSSTSLSSASASPSGPPSPPSPLSPTAAAVPSLDTSYWKRSFTSLVSSVQSKLPFLAARAPSAPPTSTAPRQKASAARGRPSATAAVHRRKRSFTEHRQSTIDEYRARVATGRGKAGLEVVIEVNDRDAARPLKERSAHRPTLDSASKKRKVKRARIREEDEDEAENDDSGRRDERMADGRPRVLAPLTSVVVEAAAIAPPVRPSVSLPESFPPLSRLSTLLACAAPGTLPPERDTEAAVWACLKAVERAIDREVDDLVASLGPVDWADRVLSFRALCLSVLEVNPQDVRVRRLCMLEPQYALWVLDVLRIINRGKQRRQSTPPESGAERVLVARPLPDVTSPRLTFRVHRRSRTQCELITRDSRSIAVSGRPPPTHRRAASVGATPTAASTAPSAYPTTFSLFLSSFSGISYPLRPPPSSSASAASAAPASPSAFLHPFLRSASGVHVLLLSLLYLSLLHTTDAAAVKKSHFALALIHRTAYCAERSSLPLQGTAERARRVRTMEAEYKREIFFLVDTLSLAIVQHDALPDLPWTAFDAVTLPDLPVAHTLGLR